MSNDSSSNSIRCYIYIWMSFIIKCFMIVIFIHNTYDCNGPIFSTLSNQFKSIEIIRNLFEFCEMLVNFAIPLCCYSACTMFSYTNGFGSKYRRHYEQINDYCYNVDMSSKHFDIHPIYGRIRVMVNSQMYECVQHTYIFQP